MSAVCGVLHARVLRRIGRIGRSNDIDPDVNRGIDLSSVAPALRRNLGVLSDFDGLVAQNNPSVPVSLGDGSLLSTKP